MHTLALQIADLQELELRSVCGARFIRTEQNSTNKLQIWRPCRIFRRETKGPKFGAGVPEAGTGHANADHDDRAIVGMTRVPLAA
jgi:hypothetical protein